MGIVQARREVRRLKARRNALATIIADKVETRRALSEKLRHKRDRDPRDAERKDELHDEIMALGHQVDNLTARLDDLRPRRHKVSRKLRRAQRRLRKLLRLSGPERALKAGKRDNGKHEEPAGSNWGPWVGKVIRWLGYSGPVYWCFAAGTLVSTPTGLRRIEEIEENDEVLSGSGVARRVVATHRHEGRDLVRIVGYGLDGTVCSTDHPYLTRRRLPGDRRRFTEPMWICAGDLRPGDLFALPKFAQPSAENVPSEAEAYLVGRYLADGWHGRQPRGVGNYSICCSHAEEPDLAEAFELAGCPAKPYRRRTDSTFVLPSRFHGVLSQAGRGARTKRVPGVVMQWPAEQRLAVLQGYVDGDGHVRPDDPDGAIANSVSRDLAMGIAHLARASERMCALNREERSATAVIEGRTINQAPYRYTMVIRPIRKFERPRFIDTETYLWSPVRSVDRVPSEPVYDLTLNEEATFIADGVVVHNCGCAAGWWTLKKGGGSYTSKIRRGYAGYVAADARAGVNGLHAVASPVPGGIASLWGYEHIVMTTGKVSGGNFQTCEGNTSAADGSQSNGGMVVYGKWRAITDADVFAKQDY